MHRITLGLLSLSLLLSCAVFPSSAAAHTVSDADAAALTTDASVGAKAATFFYLGAKHMVTGYDHLLFILGVVFLLTSTGAVVKLASTFTLGHSITLIGATLLGITFNYFLIDALIGLSVIYKGYDNLYGIRRLVPWAPSVAVIIFAFGLIHGFGLSTRLQALPLPEEHLLGYIISFNVGVEVGQLLALLVFVLVLNQVRKTRYFAPFKLRANQGLIVAGAFLVAYQLSQAIRSSL